MAEENTPNLLGLAGQQVDESTLRAALAASQQPEGEVISNWPKLEDIKEVKIPDAVDINSLPEDKRKEALEALKSMTEGDAAKPETIPEEPKGPAPCTYCGRDPAAKLPDISAEDKRSYLRSAMSGKPWYKTYELFGGKFKVTFRTRNMAENDLISEQCALEINDGRVLTNTLGLASQVYMIRLRRLQLAASLAKVDPYQLSELPFIISDEGRRRYAPEYHKNKDGNEVLYNNPVGVAHDALFRSWPDFIFALVFKEYNNFENDYIRITERAGDPDFLKGIDG
jgi:hypothetical protein